MRGKDQDPTPYATSSEIKNKINSKLISINLINYIISLFNEGGGAGGHPTE
jgi:hypothetical protein